MVRCFFSRPPPDTDFFMFLKLLLRFGVQKVSKMDPRRCPEETQKSSILAPWTAKVPKRVSGGRPSQKRLPKKGLQGCKMTSKMTSQGFQQVKGFANLTDLEHLKNASIPSMFLTTWRLRSGCRVHYTLSAVDWFGHRHVWRPLLACPREPRGHVDGTVAGFAKHWVECCSNLIEY